MSFKSEKEMSKSFKAYFSKELKCTGACVIEECKGLFGIPDYVVVENDKNELKNIVAIELKIKNWKRALIQAFKYKSFAHKSIVVIDENFKHRALKNIEDFKRLKIGLASFNSGKEFVIHYMPEQDNPFSASYYDVIRSQIRKKSSKPKIKTSLESKLNQISFAN
jgi:hypothetical protein